jgi:hypothetical protein
MIDRPPPIPLPKQNLSRVSIVKLHALRDEVLQLRKFVEQVEHLKKSTEDAAGRISRT